MEYIYRLIRRNTRPIPRERARRYKHGLSLAYYMLAWTAAGLLVYGIGTSPQGLPDHLNVHDESGDVKKRPAAKFAQIFDADNAVIVKMKNFSVDEVTDYQAAEHRGPKEKAAERQLSDFYGDSDVEGNKS